MNNSKKLSNPKLNSNNLNNTQIHKSNVSKQTSQNHLITQTASINDKKGRHVKGALSNVENVFINSKSYTNSQDRLKPYGHRKEVSSSNNLTSLNNIDLKRASYKQLNTSNNVNSQLLT